MGKQIEFGYNGGEYVQRYTVDSRNLPVSTSCDAEWLDVTTGPSSATLIAEPNRGFQDRTCQVTLSDRAGNTVTVDAVQHGFTDLRVECPDHIAIPYTHYKNGGTYDVYITSYGGSCGVIVSGVSKDLGNVWNLSGTYRDYILHIPHGKSGTVTVTHSDIKSYKEWCKSAGIPFDESRLKRKISIVQVSEADMRGKIKLTGKGLSETDFGYTASVRYGSDTVAEIQECRYSRVGSDGLAETVSEDTLYVSDVPEWLFCRCEKGRLLIKPFRPNPFADTRKARLKLASLSNPKLCITLEVVQEPSTVKG